MDLVGCLKVRHLLQARGAPGSPQVEHNGPTIDGVQFGECGRATADAELPVHNTLGDRWRGR